MNTNYIHNSREAWLDNAKMFAMICVVAGHVGGMVGGWPWNIGGYIVAFNMPLFMLLCGLTALHGLLKIHDIKSLFQYIDKQLWRIAIPAVCLSAIDQAWIGLIFSRKLWVIFAAISIFLYVLTTRGESIYRKKLYLQHLSSALKYILILFLLVSSFWLNMYWFLATLLKLQMTLAIMMLVGNRVLNQRFLIPIFATIIWIGSYFVYNSWTFEMSFFFGLGLVMKQFSIFDRLFSMNIGVSIFMFILGCVLCNFFTINYGFYFCSLQDTVDQGLPYLYPLRTIIAVLMSSPLVRWIYGLSKSYSWFSYMGQFTLAFYMIHCLLLDDFIKPYISIPFHGLTLYIIGLLIIVLLIAVVYAIIRCCQLTRLTRCLVLGK